MLVESPPTASRSETNGMFLFFQSGICFRCRLDNPHRFTNFQLPTIGVTADFYILHFLDNRRCSYTINFVQRKHNFCCKWTCLYTYIQVLQEVRRHGSFKAGLTLEGDSGEEVALWLLTSLCTSAKREVEVAVILPSRFANFNC